MEEYLLLICQSHSRGIFMGQQPVIITFPVSQAVTVLIKKPVGDHQVDAGVRHAAIFSCLR